MSDEPPEVDDAPLIASDEPSLTDAASELRTGERDLFEYVGGLVDRAEAVEPTVGALLAEPDRRDRLTAAAAALRDRHPDPNDRPPLYGVPVGVKDILHVDGFPTRAGSSLPISELTGAEAGVVSALREAGALILGKTVTTEFAYFEPGPTRNPHDPGRTPGGSSSGSAAAVAAGETPLALGSQTVGSVLRPAAFCGVVGLKPSYGRVPIDGVLPLAESVDHVGAFTRDVADVRTAAPVLYETWEPVEDPGRPVLGVPDEAYLDQASGAGRERFDAQVDALDERVNDLVAAEAALAHAEWFREYGDQYAEATAELIRDGHSVSVEGLAVARAGRRELRARLADAMADEGIDVWLSPAAPGPAPEGIGDTGDPVMNLPWTHAGVPAVSLPGGRAEGLPVGLQCAAAFGDDERLLAWADSIAAALGDAS